MIKRTQQQFIQDKLFKGKAIVVFGPRQVGKTTLLEHLVKKSGADYATLNGDDPTVRQLLDNPNTNELSQIIGSKKLLLIDEAQRVSNIGITSKIITDQFTDVQLILSGSSVLDLNSSIQESLTGRKRTFELFPVSWEEWQNHIGFVESEQNLETRLIYGMYPDVLNHPTDQAAVLLELVESYLYKDLLAYSGIRKPAVIQKLVQALALQVGQEVVLKELGDLIGLDYKTVDNYIDVLEKSYVIFRLPALSKNVRNEIKKNKKIYFYDNGVRNAVINDLRPFSNRVDKGYLWENFLVSERVKLLRYYRPRTQCYFWRTKQQQEVDFVEEIDGSTKAFEFKWKAQTIRFSKTFTDAYTTNVKGIHRENFREFIIPQ